VRVRPRARPFRRRGLAPDRGRGRRSPLGRKRQSGRNERIPRPRPARGPAGHGRGRREGNPGVCRRPGGRRRCRRPRCRSRGGRGALLPGLAPLSGRQRDCDELRAVRGDVSGVRASRRGFRDPRDATAGHPAASACIGRRFLERVAACKRPLVETRAAQPLGSEADGHAPARECGHDRRDRVAGAPAPSPAARGPAQRVT